MWHPHGLATSRDYVRAFPAVSLICRKNNFLTRRLKIYFFLPVCLQEKGRRLSVCDLLMYRQAPTTGRKTRAAFGRVSVRVVQGSKIGGFQENDNCVNAKLLFCFQVCQNLFHHAPFVCFSASGFCFPHQKNPIIKTYTEWFISLHPNLKKESLSVNEYNLSDKK